MPVSTVGDGQRGRAPENLADPSCQSPGADGALLWSQELTSRLDLALLAVRNFVLAMETGPG